METVKSTRERRVRRPRLKRTGTTPVHVSSPQSFVTPEMLEELESWAQQSSPPVPPTTNEQQKPLAQSIVELIFDIGIEAAKKAWKETDPDSYALNRATFALAPYWPAQDAWMLNWAALLTTGYGMFQVAERRKNDARRSR